MLVEKAAAVAAVVAADEWTWIRTWINVTGLEWFEGQRV